MYKRGLVIVFLVFLLMINIKTDIVYSSEQDSQYIRIGLKNCLESDYSVKLRSDKGFSIGDFDHNYKEMFNIDFDYLFVRVDCYDANKTIASDENTTSLNEKNYHIEIDKKFKKYSEAKEKSDNLKEEGFDAYPVLNEEFTIYIGDFKSKENAQEIKVEIENKLNEKTKIVKNIGNNIVIENINKEIMLLYNKNENLVFKPLCENEDLLLTQVEDKRYRDYIMFNIFNNKLIVINYITIQHYLYGVVPTEMSSNWPLEALKAQAVAARNYAFINMNKYDKFGYDLCDTYNSQVYGGYDSESIRSNKAVDSTLNKTIKYHNKLISAFYHASSGGHTENSENVWSAKLPYLRAIEDEFSIDSPHSNWKFNLSKSEISNKLKEQGFDIGLVMSIRPIKTSDSGRVIQLLIEGTKSKVILKNNDIRKVFGYYNLKSTLFDINSDVDVYIMDSCCKNPVKKKISNISILSNDGKKYASRDSFSRNLSTSLNKFFSITDGKNNTTISSIPNEYVFSGQGWGHGLGMSQWGAKNMAELGYNYIDILEYYYKGTKVK